jgi:hypothetical protein
MGIDFMPATIRRVFAHANLRHAKNCVEAIQDGRCCISSRITQSLPRRQGEIRRQLKHTASTL